MRRGISTVVPLVLLLAGCGPNLPDITGPLNLVDLRNNIHVNGSDEPDEENNEWNEAIAWDDTYGFDFDGRFQVRDESNIDMYFEPPSFIGILSPADRAVFGNSQLNLYGMINDNESLPDNVYCTLDSIEAMISNAQEIEKPVLLARSLEEVESSDTRLVLIFVNQGDYETVVAPYCPEDNAQEQYIM